MTPAARAMWWLPAILASMFAASPAGAAQLTYTLFVLGLPVADAAMAFDLTPAGYALNLRFHTTGVASLFSGDRLETHSRGRIEQDRLVPLDYRAAGRLRGRDRLAALAWRGAIPETITLSPPNDGERPEVPPPSRAGTVDPLATLAILIRDVARTGRCDNSARTFDGRKLEQFDVRTVGQEELPRSVHTAFAGPGLRCTYVRRVLAGARFDNDGEDDRTRTGSLWLGQVLPGLPPLPMRVVAETQWLGDATIYLTGATR